MAAETSFRQVWRGSMGGQWTDKREALLRHYISNGFNATKAAEAAGYALPNKQGPMLVNLGIFRDRLAQVLEEAGISEAEIRYRLTRVARMGIAEFFRVKDDRSGIEVELGGGGQQPGPRPAAEDSDRRGWRGDDRGRRPHAGVGAAGQSLWACLPIA